MMLCPPYACAIAVATAVYTLAGVSAERTSVYEIMTKPALTLNAQMNVKYAIRLLARLGLSRALVANGEKVLGVVTLRDLVLSYANPEAPAS